MTKLFEAGESRPPFIPGLDLAEGFFAELVGPLLEAHIPDMMRLAFLMERSYPPYPKWLGSAFAQLQCAPTLLPLLERVGTASEWEERDGALADAYRKLAERDPRSVCPCRSREYYDFAHGQFYQGFKWPPLNYPLPTVSHSTIATRNLPASMNKPKQGGYQCEVAVAGAQGAACRISRFRVEAERRLVREFGDGSRGGIDADVGYVLGRSNGKAQGSVWACLVDGNDGRAQRRGEEAS